MSAMWILVLLIVSFIGTRLFRSTKMWWTFMSAIMAGLLVGMLSKEVERSIVKKDQSASVTQLVNTVNDVSAAVYMQSLVESDSSSTIASLGLQVINSTLLCSFDALTNNTLANGRDSPLIEDDS